MKNNKYYLESIEARTLLAGLDLAEFLNADFTCHQCQSYKVEHKLGFVENVLATIGHAIVATPSVIASIPDFCEDVSEKAISMPLKTIIP